MISQRSRVSGNLGRFLSRTKFEKKITPAVPLTLASLLPVSAPITRFYHSYPDPNEKAEITHSVSSTKTKLDKSQPQYQLDEKFKLDKLFPGIETTKTLSADSEPETKSTVLENGLTVVSLERPGLMNSFAFLVKAGSSFEDQSNSPSNNCGVTHFLELNGFRSTRNVDAMELISEVDSLGGMAQCLTTRDYILYFIDVLHQHSDRAVELMAEAVLYPTFPPEEMEESKQVVLLQEENFPPEMISKEACQLAAFKNSPLSNHHYCPPEALENITAEKIKNFRESYYYGSNCLISATLANTTHEEFVEIVKKHFGDMHKKDTTVDAPQFPPPSVYTGGIVKMERPLREDFVRCAIAFKIGGWKDDLLIAMCVLQQLLGGGSSFSAGGPGKGMYTRLYSEVLNKCGWIESIEAFNSIHMDSGIFGIDGSCKPEAIQGLIREILVQLVSLCKTEVADDELLRAKNMLKFVMMSQLESRLMVCEDILRQFGTYGKRHSPRFLCDQIDAVTKEDIMKLAKMMLKTRPSIGIVGNDLQFAPDYEIIEKYYNSLLDSEFWESEK